MPATQRFGPTRRGGPVFRWLGEPLAVDLANTVMALRPDREEPGGKGETVDLLATPDDLRRWLAAEGGRLAGFAVSPEGDLDRVRKLRGAVRELLSATVDGTELPASAVRTVNSVSASAAIAPQLGRGAGGLTVTLLGDDSVTGMLGAIARSAIELVDETPAGGLRICGAPSCGMFYLGARRWCCSACGNRARAARHYRRHRRPAVAARGGADQ